MPFKRYSLTDITANRFYQMPKFLFQGDLKRGLSNDAKILYSLLRDRHELSIKNNWINEKKEVYLIFTRDEMADLLGCSQPTLRKAITALKTANLMDEESQGLNRPNLIFLNYITDMSELPTAPKPDNGGNNGENTGEEQNPSGVKESFGPESTEQGNRDEKNLRPGVKESFSPDCKNLSLNDTDSIETDLSETDLIYLSPFILEVPSETGQMDTIEQSALKGIKRDPPTKQSEDNSATDTYANTAKIVKSSMEYDVLISKGVSRERLDEIVGLITDVLISHTATIRVNRENMPRSVVMQQFMKLSAEHIEYVIEQVENQTVEIKNIRQYLITALYNAPYTYENYIAQKLVKIESDYKEEKMGLYND